MFKTCALGTLYGLGAKGMANKLNMPDEAGRQLIRYHKTCYPDFWQWSQIQVSSALLRQRWSQLWDGTLRYLRELMPTTAQICAL